MGIRNMIGLLLFVTVTTTVFSASSSNAQSKIAFIDVTKLLKQLPESQDADARLSQLIAGWNKEAGDMQNELDRKRTDFERKKLIMTDAERSSIELDMTELKKRLDQFRQSKYGPNGELATQQASLMKPANDKLLKAIEEVALDGKYDYVFDKSSKELALLYTNAKFDLTNAVAKKLGLETNDIFSTPLLNRINPGQGSPVQQHEPISKPIPVDPMNPSDPPIKLPVQSTPH